MRTRCENAHGGRTGELRARSCRRSLVAAQASNRGTADGPRSPSPTSRSCDGSRERGPGSAAGERGILRAVPLRERHDDRDHILHATRRSRTRSGTGRLYLSVGHIYHTMGPGRWGATHVDEKGAYFVPQMNAHNTFVVES